MIFDAPNRNLLWAGLLVEELVRNGVDHFFLAPGSRSSPLTAAVALHPKAERVMHFDERGTAFAALGYARATGRPAAWITTSGTAVANGMPAVVEAATDGVPMVLLTADRPPELRETGANQTIDQPDLFGAYVRWRFDLPAPDETLDLAFPLTTVDQAVYRAGRAPGGPVHLNCMFREPLAPDEAGRATQAERERLRVWTEAGVPYTTYTPPQSLPDPAATDDLAAALRGVERGIVVAGRMRTPDEGRAALRLAERLGWPLFPDAGSQVRLGREHEAPARVAFFDHVLTNEGFAHAHRPEAVIHLGGRATSKRLARFLEIARPALFAVVRNDPFRFDPAHQATHRFESGIAEFCEALGARIEKRTAGAWMKAWRTRSDRVRARMTAFFSEAGTLSEPAVAHLVTRHVPGGSGLVLASSMPVRDVDVFATSDGDAACVAANRGASGIDGTVATAVGFAHGIAAPVTLLIGDLALLHDLNALALVRTVAHPFVIVAVNNDGGGIFHFLPIARHKEIFEPYFGTPHGRSFEPAARMFDLAYARPATKAAFVEAFREAHARRSGMLIEVRTDREENIALHRMLEARAAEAVG
ncbi:2-succinyl-5-enolpyruvyl-6-hydroxy-3-cyclohexene-1-carboxylic-acid synthase [Rhodocaloribacter sp.]